MAERAKKDAARTRVSQSDVPRHPLGEALRVARALEDHYGGGDATPLDVAASLGSTPSSSWFRTITGAAIAYGLTDGGPNSAVIKLTSLGRRAVAPTDEGEDRRAIGEALLRPRVLREFLTRYDGKKLPPENIAVNVITSLQVAKDAAPRTHKIILESAEFAGATRTIKDQTYVDLRGVGKVPPVDPSASAEEAVLDDDVVHEGETGLAAEPPPSPAPPSPPAAAQPRPIFLGHGKKHGPLEKLRKILDSFKIPYRVVVDEPNLMRPIPQKVKEVLKECGSAILIFTRDEQFFDVDGNEVWRPSENVVYELGAASFEYDDRVVIMMEKGLTFPANFNSVGHIEFEESVIEAKTMELVQELIGLGLVQISPVG